MRITGLVTIAILCAIPLIWLPSIATGRDGVALFSQYLGMVSLILMAITQLIATRAAGIETVFGPMDRAYVLHKWLGIAALAAMFLHDTIDAEMRNLGPETLLSEVAETAGEISIYAILILVVITIATFIPYHLWRWTHRFMGALYALAAFHYLFILKPFSNTDPLGLYMMAICAVGILAYAVTLAPFLRRSHAYKIASIDETGPATSLVLTPEHGGLRHAAGQFAIFSFAQSGLSEPHPFTISAAPSETRALRITFAPLGDFTHDLPRKIAVGHKVHVEGPYGRFSAPRGNKPQTWIAAGIGITPFVALAENLSADGPATNLIICTRDAANIAHLDDLEAQAKAKPNLTIHIHASVTSGRLDEEALLGYCPDIGSSKVLFCGPTPMRESLSKILRGHGVQQRDFHFEEFEFRTGIGLRKLSDALRKRLQTR